MADDLNESVDSIDLSFDDSSPPSPMKSSTNVTVVDVEPQQVVALLDYKAEEMDDLSFKKGDVVTITRKDGSGWAEGSLEDGSKGWFPLEKVEKVFESPVAEVGQATGTSALDAFIQEAKEGKGGRQRLLNSGGKKPKLDKRDSLRVFLASRPMKEQLVEKAILPSSETSEQVQAAQKRLLKQQKKKKKKLDVADKIIGGWAPELPENKFSTIKEEQFNEIALSLLEIPVSKQKAGFTSHEDVFNGATLMQHLRSAEVAKLSPVLKDMSPDDAQALGDVLLQRNVITDVEGKKTFKAKHLFQSTCSLVDYSCVNVTKVAVGKAPNAYEQSVALVTAANKVYNAHLPDFEKLRKSPDLQLLSLQMAELQNVSLDKLSNKEKKCFWVNCYNVMVLFAHAKFTPPMNTLDKRYLFEHCTLLAGRQLYSLQDLEMKAYSFATKKDPSVYFCLSDGTKSTPANYIFTKEDFDMTKLYAARRFLDQTVVVDASDYAITLPKICQRMWKDVGIEKKDLVNTIQPFLAKTDRVEIDRLLEVGPLDIKFSDYRFDPSYIFQDAVPLSPR